MAGPEQQIQRAILDYLALRGHLAVKVNNGGIRKPDGSYIPSRQQGVSDILGVQKGTGRFFALEVKAPKGRLSPDQEAFLHTVKALGGLALVAYSVEDAQKAGL